MVHEREDSVTCGPIMPQGGIQVKYSENESSFLDDCKTADYSYKQ